MSFRAHWGPSDDDDVEELLQAGEVAWVARVEPGGVRMRGRCNQKIHDARSRLATS